MAPARGPARPYWHARGYVPHHEWPGAKQFVTFRLADSLPAEFVRAQHRGAIDETLAARMERLRATEAELDACRGECPLRARKIAAAVEESLLHFNGERYRLLAWVIMPNHVHVVIQLKAPWTLSRVLHTWKWRSAAAANAILGRTGRFWQPEYFDRVIRDEEHLERCVRYVENNPVKAGLCRDPAGWPFGSARHRRR